MHDLKYIYKSQSYKLLNQNIEYINGATTDPCEDITRAAIGTIVSISGANQYFFLTFMKSQISFISSKNAFIFKMV